jgi:hypothetical protein
MTFIDWVCFDCGKKHGRRGQPISTWHTGICDVCGRETGVTEPRDFGMPLSIEDKYCKKGKKNHE